jgi:hypothetical protein
MRWDYQQGQVVIVVQVYPMQQQATLPSLTVEQKPTSLVGTRSSRNRGPSHDANTK